MKLCIVISLIFASNVVYGQWASRVYLEEAVNYFDKVIEETFLELEDKGFCNLKLLNYTQTISQQMYKWLVAGNITYADGFLVSIQKVDVTDVEQLVGSITVDGEVQTTATIRGMVNLRDNKVGYDVIAELGENGDHRFTGTFVHTLTRLQYAIQKNLHTQEITISQTLSSLSGGLDRMVFMPANNLTQVISRTYVPSNVWDSVISWRDIIVPIMTNIVTNIHEFPPICLDCR